LSSYSGTADRPDRAKAIAAVLAVHAALAFVILSGLNVEIVSKAVERLNTFNLQQPPTPPPVPPPPQPRQQRRAAEEAGAPAKKAEPTPVVAPQPRIPAASSHASRCDRGRSSPSSCA